MIVLKLIDVRAVKLRMGQGPSTFWDFGQVFKDVPYALITIDVSYANGDKCESITIKPELVITEDVSPRTRKMIMFNDEHIGFMNELSGQLEIFNGNDGIEVVICCYIDACTVEYH